MKIAAWRLGQADAAQRDVDTTLAIASKRKQRQVSSGSGDRAEQRPGCSNWRSKNSITALPTMTSAKLINAHL